MSSLKELQIIAKDVSILYVEDNELLREKASVFLEKFFKKVDLAEDGRIGLEKFKKFHYSIVITDIKMPNMDGMILSSKIKRINPDTKIIVMSAFDDRDLLLKGRLLGLFRFLKKPVDVKELGKVLLEAVIEIKHEYSTKLFHTHLHNVFNYQNSMVVMLNDCKPVIANQIFLDFFAIENIDDFNSKYDSITAQFLEHDGFLYNDEENKYFDILVVKNKHLSATKDNFLL